MRFSSLHYRKYPLSSRLQVRILPGAPDPFSDFQATNHRHLFLMTRHLLLRTPTFSRLLEWLGESRMWNDQQPS